MFRRTTSFVIGFSSARLITGHLFPCATQVHDHLDRLLHVLHRHPFQPRVEVVLPAKMFGVGRPMNDRRDPAVPPQIGRVRGSRPARLIASRAGVFLDPGRVREQVADRDALAVRRIVGQVLGQLVVQAKLAAGSGAVPEDGQAGR